MLSSIQLIALRDSPLGTIFRPKRSEAIITVDVFLNRRAPLLGDFNLKKRLRDRILPKHRESAVQSRRCAQRRVSPSDRAKVARRWRLPLLPIRCSPEFVNQCSSVCDSNQSASEADLAQRRAREALIKAALWQGPRPLFPRAAEGAVDGRFAADGRK
jgi:hypothetical protein